MNEKRRIQELAGLNEVMNRVDTAKNKASNVEDALVEFESYLINISDDKALVRKVTKNVDKIKNMIDKTLEIVIG